MSDTYDTNDFGEVVTYTFGRRTNECRCLTGYEEQLINELDEMKENFKSFESLVEEKEELEQKVAELEENNNYNFNRFTEANVRNEALKKGCLKMERKVEGLEKKYANRVCECPKCGEDLDKFSNYEECHECGWKVLNKEGAEHE